MSTNVNPIWRRYVYSSFTSNKLTIEIFQGYHPSHCYTLNFDYDDELYLTNQRVSIMYFNKLLFSLILNNYKKAVNAE